MIAWAGRIDPIKDVETLLRAAAIVVAERPEVTFKLYGSASKASRATSRRACSSGASSSSSPT